MDTIIDVYWVVWLLFFGFSWGVCTCDTDDFTWRGLLTALRVGTFWPAFVALMLLGLYCPWFPKSWEDRAADFLFGDHQER